MTFELADSDYIELKNLLKVSGLCADGGNAKDVISKGLVSVDGHIELRKGCKIRKGQKIEYLNKMILVT